MKKIAVLSCFTAILALNAAGCGNESVKLHKPVLESLKANGESCVSFSECQSKFCNINNICDDSPVQLKPNGEACTSNGECQSNYCNDNSLCDDKPVQLKPNGDTCTSGSECQSDYCNANGLCDNKPVQLKPNGEACENDSECQSDYCNDSNLCDDKPSQLKPNGEACENGSECVSGYCNDSNLCDDKPVQLKPNGEACEIGSECQSGYCNDSSLCDKKPDTPVTVLELQEVPEDQVNTAGAECDPDTFVSHCNGNTAVWCEVNSQNKPVVKSDVCADDYPTCSLTLMDNKNYPSCVGESLECTKGSKEEVECTTDMYNYELRAAYTCMQHADGKYYYTYHEDYCSELCSTKGCKTESCDPNLSKCGEGNTYTLECDEIAPGKYIYKAQNCSPEDAVCATLQDGAKTWAYCSSY